MLVAPAATRCTAAGVTFGTVVFTGGVSAGVTSGFAGGASAGVTFGSAGDTTDASDTTDSIEASDAKDALDIVLGMNSNGDDPVRSKFNATILSCTPCQSKGNIPP